MEFAREIAARSRATADRTVPRPTSIELHHAPFPPHRRALTQNLIGEQKS